MTVQLQTNLVVRGKAHYFRKKVPADLRRHYGRESIRQSLAACGSLKEAKAEAARLADQWEADFAHVRRSLASPPAPLTVTMVPALAAAFEASIMRADEGARTDGMTEQEFATTTELTAAELRAVKAAYARGDAEPVSRPHRCSVTQR